MTEAEALELLAAVESAGKTASVRHLANGEFVVILQRKSVHLWSWEDWERIQGEKQPVAAAV